MTEHKIYRGIRSPAVSALTNMYTAIVNMRLFAPSNPTIGNFVGAAYVDLLEMFNNQGSILFTGSERVLFVNGERLSEGEQKNLR